jgi:hypothetical protein
MRLIPVSEKRRCSSRRSSLPVHNMTGVCGCIAGTLGIVAQPDRFHEIRIINARHALRIERKTENRNDPSDNDHNTSSEHDFSGGAREMCNGQSPRYGLVVVLESTLADAESGSAFVPMRFVPSGTQPPSRPSPDPEAQS